MISNKIQIEIQLINKISKDSKVLNKIYVINICYL